MNNERPLKSKIFVYYSGNLQVFFICPLVCLFLAFFSQTSAAASLDCAKPASDIEKTICADAELVKLAEQMHACYKAWKENKEADPEVIRMITFQQREWLKKRDACNTDVSCLKDVYEKFLKRYKCTEMTGNAAILPN